MSLIVEDGTGLSTAESYISVADADTYFINRGVTSWDALDNTDDKEPALRKATEYMINKYRRRWQGARVYQIQALDWPRVGVVVDSWSVASDEVPTEVARACAELALKANAEDLQPDLEQGVIREKVDVIEVEYDKNSPQAIRYSQIDSMLAPFLSGIGGASVGLIRT
jgi:hypothetical protein